MQLDHVSYAVLPSELPDTIQRIGSQLGAAFIDGGRHPSFGTRNFVLPLSGGTYFEIVSPLDHPAAEQAPFGRAVRERAETGGGWMGWVVQVQDLAPIEKRLGRNSVKGHRIRPDGVELTWRQIGLLDLIEDPQLPYYIKWDDAQSHPSSTAPSAIRISELAISGDSKRVVDWLGDSGEAFVDGLNLNWVEDEESRLVSVTFETSHGTVVID
ncbi:MAG: VOC family protein [Actinobacteria bacterium]|uniref:Unannotated protein n=1 Tax=freshwater metagenome TaxID=449393 RepID=A0A6J5ZPT5_9ZZZZ|nr:VOC family protein [Actinomycetota bacterium]